jgi:[NiFe] hydrogenase assembly HybE family chaperone
MPIVDPAIEVDAVSFAHTADGCLGVLIAPWLIDRILLRCEGGDWRDRPPGSLQRHRFASGDDAFRHAGAHPIGRYPSCFLPAALHDPAQQDTASRTRPAEIAHGRSGAVRADPAARAARTADSSPAPAPLGRRAFPAGRAHDESGGPG